MTVHNSTITPQTISPRSSHVQAELAKVQCSRCLNTMEIPTELFRRYLRCDRCHRNLRAPRVIRHGCAHCGCFGEFSPDTSGRRVNCPECSMRILMPIQIAHPKRRRRRSPHRPRRDSSALPLVISLGISMLGLILCFRLLSNL